MPKRYRTAVVFWSLCVSAGPFLAGAEVAYAHKLKIFATTEGRTISGYAYLSGGARPRNVTVEFHSPASEKLGETKTNEKGEFTFTAKYKCDHLLRIDIGDGHGADFVVKAYELPDNLPVPGASAGTPAEAGSRPASPVMMEEAIARNLGRQIRPLREQLDRMEENIRFRDVLGGIGYLFGVAGIVFYFLGVRKARTPRSPAPPARTNVERDLG